MRADLVFAVVADVVHAHEDRQKLPVLLKVQTLQRSMKTRACDCQENPSFLCAAEKLTD